MLRSLFSGVSGLKNQQTSMDVISNNIANATTTAFKASRITFSDALSETLSGARGTAGNFGGANPIQVGRGSVISSIDTNYKQGSLDSTGLITDLAINGKGFFVLSDGEKKYFSRAGALQVQEDGTLMAQGGTHYVQGRLADSDGKLNSTTTMSNIILPFGRKEPAKATDDIQLYCNLDVNASKVEEWLGSTSLTVNGEAATSSTDIAKLDNTAIYAGDVIEISGKDKEGNRISTTFTYGFDGTKIDDLINVVNDLFKSEDQESGASLIIDDNGKLRLRANRAGETDISIFMKSASNNHEATTETHVSETGWIAEAGANSATRLNAINQITTPYVSGDTLDITVGGETQTFTFNTGNETISDLVDWINNASTFTAGGAGVSVEINSDGVIVNNGINGDIAVVNGAANTGSGLDGNPPRYTIQLGSASLGTQLNNIMSTERGKVITDYAAGDTLRITGTNPDGSEISTEFTFEDGTETVEDLLALINRTYTGVTATINTEGNIILTDNSTGDSRTSISITNGPLNSTGTGLDLTFSTEVFSSDEVFRRAAGTNAVDHDEINSLSQITTDYINNDLLVVTINGETHNFVYGVQNDGTSLGDLVDWINSGVFSGAASSVVAGMDSNGSIVDIGAGSYAIDIAEGTNNAGAGMANPVPGTPVQYTILNEGGAHATTNIN
ncbi:MAG: flagellar hook-basal body complex protein, partial [Candidatus Cloacimonetes bacterium]|nr:flagellar hook-basal body complex protein [Candidatus Cloacimonadota bacterium]